ncbi:MAG: hypothetical protein RJA70_2919 [Pseudomonadota bacterium]|jgi:hypothetical protein
MDANVRRRALRAAAKVAFGAAFLGACGSNANDSALRRHPVNNAGDSGAETDSRAETNSPTVPNHRTDAGLTGQTPIITLVEREAPAVGDSGLRRDAQAASGLACVEHVELTADRTSSVPEPAALSCCVAYNDQRLVESAVDGGNGPASYPALAADESFVNCCRLIINAASSLPETWTALRTSCCASDVHGFDPEGPSPQYQHIYCTPWGPAVPPSMDYVAQGVA